jgi:hypothetical protein
VRKFLVGSSKLDRFKSGDQMQGRPWSFRLKIGVRLTVPPGNTVHVKKPEDGCG